MAVVTVFLVVVVAIGMTVEVVVIVTVDIEVTVEVVVTGAGEAVQIPWNSTDAFLPGGREPRLLTSSIVKEPVASWPLGSYVSSGIGTAQVEVTTPMAGKRFATNPPTVP